MRTTSRFVTALSLIVGIFAMSTGATPVSAFDSPFPFQASSGGFRSIQAAPSYVCALSTAGEIYCWGDAYAAGNSTYSGSAYYIGNQAGEVQTAPAVNLGTDVRVHQFDIGTDSTCAVIDTGAVKCWGSNANGKLGLGDTTSRLGTSMGSSLTSVDLGTNVTAIQVGVGANHACALLNSRDVKCWGKNDVGQLGIGNTTTIGDNAGEMGSALLTVDLGTGVKVREMHVGANHTCVLTTTGVVKCWGKNDVGQLGIGSTTSIGDNAGEMGSSLAAVSLPSGTVQRLFGGENTTCVRTSTNSYCWGAGLYGLTFNGFSNNVGDGAGEMGSSLAAMSLGTYLDLMDYSSSTTTAIQHACAIVSTGGVKCVGDNTYGQLGRGNTTNFGIGASEIGVNLAVVDLGLEDQASDVAVTDGFSCALLVNGEIKCWGRNQYGQLGVGSTTTIGDGSGEMGTALQSVPVSNTLEVANIIPGGTSTCATLTNGSAKCWGNNDYGQLGQGNTTSFGSASGALQSVNPIRLGSDRVRATYTGGSHSCSISIDHRVQCWGSNSSGQLGYGDLNSRGDGAGEMGSSLGYVDLGTGSYVTQLALGLAHTCALLESGYVKCWGENGKGQLGYDNASDVGDASGEMGASLGYVNLGTGRRAIKITAGMEFTCALLDNGTIKCWGRNQYGQLGQGSVTTLGDTTGEMAALAAIDLNGTAVDISAGGYHACAVLDDGTVKCWGLNSEGQLGLGNTTTIGDGASEMGASLSSVNFNGIIARSALSVAAGNGHTCVLLNNQTVKCWGRGNNGQLGYGNTTTIGDGAGELGTNLGTVNLGTGRNAIQLAVGSNHTCVVLDNGTAKCWGLNNYGQLAQTSAAGSLANTMGDNLPAIVIPDTVRPTATWSTSSPTILTTNYDLSFDEPVYGIDNGDFTTSGTAPGCTADASVTDSTHVIVQVSCTGDGTVTPTLVASGFADLGGNSIAANQAASSTTFDSTAPTATITTPGSSVGTYSPVFTVNFSESVTGILSSDFSVTGTALPCVISTSGSSGASVEITANCSNSGTVALTLGAGRVVDGYGNTGPSASVTSSSVTINTTSPTPVITSPTSPRSSRTLTYSVVFNQSVTGLATNDFSTTGTATCSVGVAGSGTTYTVTLTCTTDGTVALHMAINAVTGTAGLGPTSEAVASTVLIDSAGPTATWVAPTSPVGSPSPTFSLTLSEDAIIGAGDITSSGTATGCSTPTPVGSGSSYTVSLTCTGDGTVALTLVGGSVADSLGNTGPSSSVTSSSVVLDNAPATALLTTTATTLGVGSFTVTATFNETVFGLDSGDFSNTGTAGGCSFATSASTGTSMTITVTCTSAGTVITTLAASSVTDPAGNSSPASPVAASSVTLDASVPSAEWATTAASLGDRTPDFTLYFDAPVTGFTTSDLSVIGGGGSCSIAGIDSTMAPIYVIGLSCTADAVGVSVRLTAGSVLSAATSTAGPGAAVTSGALTIDTVSPTVSWSTTPASTSRTRNLDYVLTFSETVFGVDSTDFDNTGTATGCVFSPTTSSGTTIPVDVDCTSDGTVVVRFGLSDSAIDGAGNVVTGTPRAATSTTVDATAPSLIWSAGSNSPGSLVTTFILNFSEAVTGLSSSDFSNAGTASGCAFTPASSSGTAINLSVTCTGAGTLVATLSTGAVLDAFGNTGPTGAGAATSLSITSAPTGLVALTPSRILDTRSGSKIGALNGTGTPRTLNVYGQGGLPSSGIGAVVLNVTVTGGENPTVGGGYVTVYPCASGRPDASNLNFEADQTIPNSVIAPVDPAGNVCFYVYGKAHLLADVSGYFPTGSSLNTLTPSRILDTRSASKIGALNGTGTPRTLNVFGQGGLPSSGIGAVVLNVTVTGGENPTVGGGYVTVYPCASGRPDASNLNFEANQTIPNSVIAPVDPSGNVCFYVYGKAHLLADVSGYFASGVGLTALSPSRILDTRSGTKIGALNGTGTPRTLNVFGQGGLPSSGIGAVVLNVTVTGGENPTVGGGYVTVYPCASGRPDASNLNFEADQTIPNSVIAPVDPSGNVCFYVYGKAHLLADVSGYFPT